MTSTRVAELVAQMTLTEKCLMVQGKDAWILPGCERLGIPEWCVSDGPVGVRGRAQGPGLVIPGPSALAATWNPRLVEKLGEALGTEAGDRNVDMILAPTVNLHRSPRGGRHFESYSEDPELSSRTAVGYIVGIQSTGVGACVKHFVANDQEHERFTIDVDVDERTLREIYLPPFEAAVAEGEVRSVMGAYNFINGHHGCAHPHMLTEILKGEWGFEGFVVSDWGAIKETVAPAVHGLDIEMPGPGKFWGKGRLEAAVAAGDVDEAHIDDKVGRILSFLEWRGRLDGTTDHTETSIDRPEHRELAASAIAESSVLVKNEAVPIIDAADEPLLPLASGKTIALIGPGAAKTAMLGGGSASLTPHRSTNVLDSLRSRLGAEAVTHAAGVDLGRRAAALPPAWIDGDVTIELFDSMNCEGTPRATEQRSRVVNVWFGESFPDDYENMAVRMSVAVTPTETGRFRANALGFSSARLWIDGELIADNTTGDSFSAGVGFHGGDGFIDLVAGQTYSFVLEHTQRAESMRIVVIDIGLESAEDNAEQLLTEAESVAAQADVAVIVAGSTSEWESEGDDRTSINLPKGQDELITRVLAANPNTVVVLNCGAPMNLPWLDAVPATMLVWYPGQEAGEAIADLLTGAVEPSGRMPTTWAVDERDTPSFLNYPGENGVVRYGEGIFVGYRSYDARGVAPRIAFGHGGGYTTWSWGEPTVAGSGTELTVTVPVTNSGDRPGADVVQVYVAPHSPPVPRPPKELAGFAKLSAAPGETTMATITLRDRSFARYDTAVPGWIVDPGSYDLVIAASATDEHPRLTIEL